MNRRPSSKLASYLVAAGLVLALGYGFSSTAYADICTGNCGSSGADGVVPLSPSGNSAFQWISTNKGLDGVGALAGVGGTGEPINGPTLQTSAFSSNAGSVLNFFFNYTTSDGSGFADYAWAELLDSSNSIVALLFTARTAPGGNSVPGFSMPVPASTLTPSTVTIHDGQTTWSPLGGSSGLCFNGVGQGCGTTGWVTSNELYGCECWQLSSSVWSDKLERRFI